MFVKGVFPFKSLGTPFTLKRLGTIAVNQLQVQFKSGLSRENFRANVTFKVLDITNTVNSLQMRFNNGFIRKLLSANVTHVARVSHRVVCCLGTRRLHFRMDGTHMFVKRITSLIVLWAKFALKRLEATQTVNRPTMATSLAHIHKHLSAYVALRLGLCSARTGGA